MPAFIGNIADLAGFISAIFVVLMYLRQRRGDDPISVVLVVDGKQVPLPITIKRRNMIRGEVLGRIGMLPMANKGSRFSLAYLATAEFLDQVDAVASGKAMVLKITATAAEVAQFDL